jgi:hypothetical protein
MSYERKKQEHGYTAIEIAMNDVQRAFSIDDPQYTWNMLRKATIISAKPEIISEMEKFMRQVNMKRRQAQVYQGVTMVDKIVQGNIPEREYLREQCFVFLQKLVEQLTLHKLWYSDHGPPTRATGLKQLADKLEYDRH